MLKELRQPLASAIADAKAYDVPSLCRRLNLGDGENREAFTTPTRRRVIALFEGHPSAREIDDIELIRSFVRSHP